MSDKKTPITKKYTNDEITVVWKPDLCIHSTLCWKNLRQVFNPKARPWVNMEGATSQAILDQVAKCPSRALSAYKNDADEAEPEVTAERIIEVSKDGPLLVYGNISVKHPNGAVEQQSRVTAFCRCGASSNKPYCDGSHKAAGFIDTAD